MTANVPKRGLTGSPLTRRDTDFNYLSKDDRSNPCIGKYLE